MFGCQHFGAFKKIFAGDGKEFDPAGCAVVIDITFALLNCVNLPPDQLEPGNCMGVFPQALRVAVALAIGGAARRTGCTGAVTQVRRAAR